MLGQKLTAKAQPNTAVSCLQVCLFQSNERGQS
jgi:hypothetical protein